MSRWTLLLLLTLRWATGVAQSQVSVTHFDEFSGMAQWYVTQIVQDRSGMIWMATWNGLNRYDGYQFECFKTQVGDGCDMPSDRIANMMLNDDGNLWCLVENHVFLFDVNTCRFSALDAQDEARVLDAFGISRDYQERYEPPYYIYKDNYGTEWKILNDGTLLWRDSTDGPFASYGRVAADAANVYFCTSDREGNAWLRSKYGAYKLTFAKPPYTRLRQTAANQVRCLYLDRRQRYWVTTRDDATIRLFDADNRELGYLGRDGRLHRDYTSFGSPVYCMLQARDGAFWLGSKPDGLFRLREQADGTFTVEQFRHSADPGTLRHDHVFHMAEDRQGRLWVATFRGGLHCIEHPEAADVKLLHTDNGLQCPSENFQLVRYIHMTDEGVMLAATTSGLLIADLSPVNARDVKFHLHSKDAHRGTSLSNNATMFIVEDARHRIFVCTESGGVNQILSDNLLADELEFRHFNMSTGFPSDVALSAVPADDHVLVVSNNQLIRLFPDESGRSEAIFWKDQLRFSDATPLHLPDGRWIFGLQDGAFFVKPADIRMSAFVPPIGLTGISVQNRQVDHAVNAVDTLTLLPPDRNVIVHFAALTYADADHVSYAFRMSDAGDTWNEIGKNRSVTLLDLEPGVHELQLRSTNGDGMWVDNVRRLTIIVRPTFWETGWARLLYFLVFAAVVGAILYTRSYIRRINQQQRETHEAYLELLNARNTLTEQQNIERQEKEVLAKTKATPQDDAFMKRVMKFIEEHIGDPDISIGDLADAAATSRSGLNRKMKSLLGVTPIDFIREARIQKACTMLAEGLPVNDVAYGCGFSDPKYFAKCFKADKGMTPTEFKAQNQRV